MAQLNIVEKKVRLAKTDIIGYQLITYCFFNNITLSKLDIDCLVQLAIRKQIELNKFCAEIGGSKLIFGSPQSVRNAINKASAKKLVIKKGKNKKLLFINPEINLQVDGSIMLDYKYLASES